MTMSPNADNPLPRYAVNKELYQQAVQLGITSESGAALADRQYQLDVNGFSVLSGKLVIHIVNELLQQLKERKCALINNV